MRHFSLQHRRATKYLSCALALGTGAFAFLAHSIRGAESGDEQRLIGILQSNTSPHEKDAACVQLKKVATPASVPALAALLTDTQLSQSARYVLESMDGPEAGRALIEAVDKTAGLLKIGIINSLGNRREAGIAAVLSNALLDRDSAVGQAAAVALGKSGDPAAAKALANALPPPNSPLHEAVVDGLLRAANQLLSAGDNASAKAMFERLYQPQESGGVRAAAHAGMIRSAGQGALALIIKGIEGTDGPSQMAALQLARDPQGPAAGQALAALLPNSKPPVQVALLEALSQRGDVLPAPIITQLAKTGTPEARTAALEALGSIGDASVVPVLAESAAAETGSLQAMARRSLSRLNRGSVLEALIKQLKEAKPPAQAEAARALGERGESTAVPTLLALAGQASDSNRRSTLQALSLLAKPNDLDALVQLVLRASGGAAREDTVQALNLACQRIKSAQGRVPTEPLVRALASANPPETRAALLSVCSGLPEPDIRSALRSALSDPARQIRVAAIRALCDTIDLELLPDLQKIACTAPEENFRALAIAGCVRLTTQDEGAKLSNQQRLATLQSILATPLNTEQKRQILSGLAEIPDPAALKLVEPMLAEPAVRSEAATAAVKIAPALADADAASAVLKKVLAEGDPAARTAAQAALKQIDARGGFITAWQAAGPFRQPNKNFSALFDTPFPPESPDAKNIQWRLLPASTDPSTPWAIDLLKAFGGEQCVAYARTWVFSPIAQPVRLEIGSDDGNKVWVNDKLVHANNTARAVQPAQDKADAQLQKGWNRFLVKVTQNNQGWGFCLRITTPDGSRVDGLRASLAPD